MQLPSTNIAPVIKSAHYILNTFSADFTLYWDCMGATKTLRIWTWVIWHHDVWPTAKCATTTPLFIYSGDPITSPGEYKSNLASQLRTFPVTVQGLPLWNSNLIRLCMQSSAVMRMRSCQCCGLLCNACNSASFYHANQTWLHVIPSWLQTSCRTSIHAKESTFVYAFKDNVSKDR